jgi:hypothetical protein
LTSSTVWEWVAHTSIANFVDLEFSSDHSWPTSMLIIFQTVYPLCKTFVPLKHNITAEGFFTVRLLDHLKRIFSVFAEFLAEFNVFPLLKL